MEFGKTRKARIVRSGALPRVRGTPRGASFG
jgi:hypothetical protein